MLNAVADRMPEIYAFCHSAYTVNHPPCFVVQFVFFSLVGRQQGNPVGPLLFCNTVQPLLNSMESVLTLGFLNDFTLGA